MVPIFSWFLLTAATVTASTIDVRAPLSDPLASCPGYKASNIKTTSSSLTADLSLAGRACNVYGTDLTDLTLSVVYETGQNFSCLPYKRVLTNMSQMTAFTSRSKMQPIASIKSQHPSSPVQSPPWVVPLRKQTSNSTIQHLRSLSQSQDPARERFSSILWQQASCSSPNTCDCAPISPTTRTCTDWVSIQIRYA
jgi:hypothetical protein